MFFGCESNDNSPEQADNASQAQTSQNEQQNTDDQNQTSQTDPQNSDAQPSCSALDYQIIYASDISGYQDKSSKIVWVNSSDELDQYSIYYPVTDDETKHSYFEKINASIDFEKASVLVLFAGHHDDAGRHFSVDKACSEQPLAITLNEYDEGDDAESSPMFIAKFSKGNYEVDYQLKHHSGARDEALIEKNKPLFEN